MAELLGKQWAREAVERATHAKKPDAAFALVYRDFVIALADGIIQGDATQVARILAAGEVRAGIDRATAELSKL